MNKNVLYYTKIPINYQIIFFLFFLDLYELISNRVVWIRPSRSIGSERHLYMFDIIYISFNRLNMARIFRKSNITILFIFIV